MVAAHSGSDVGGHRDVRVLQQSSARQSGAQCTRHEGVAEGPPAGEARGAGAAVVLSVLVRMRQRYVARTLALSIAVIVCATTASCSTSNAFAYSGTVQTESAAVGSTIGGRVVAVLVSPG